MYDWRTTLWRQGSILKPEDAAAIGLIEQGEVDSKIVIIASHDCDLTQSPEAEPHIEFIIGSIIQKIDGNFVGAKTARKLHTSLMGQAPIMVEFEAPKKSFTSKERFQDITPTTQLSLSADDRSIYQYWLSSRYNRSAFPDEFENRLKAANLVKAISSAVKLDGEYIAAVLFNLDDGEDNIRVGDDDLYKLEIYVLYASEPDDAKAFQIAKTAVQKIAQAFHQKLFEPTNCWKGIELVLCDAISDAAMPYVVFRRLKRWRLDYLSLVDVPQQEIAPD